jgi:hypothetical protein
VYRGRWLVLESVRKKMWQLSSKLGLRAAKATAVALALLSLLFLLQVAPHNHAKGQDEATCRLCQAGHVSVTPAISGILLTIPLVPVGEVAVTHVSTSTESFLCHSDPRAPPSSFQS